MSARLNIALESGVAGLPTDGRIAVFRPRAGADLSALPRDRFQLIQGFRPDHDAFAALGYDTAVAPGGDFAAALVCLPRAKAEARGLVARAMALTGGIGERGLPETYLAAAATLIALYPVCLLWRRYKRAHPNGWAQYV